MNYVEKIHKIINQIMKSIRIYIIRENICKIIKNQELYTQSEFMGIRIYNSIEVCFINYYNLELSNAAQ